MRSYPLWSIHEQEESSVTAIVEENQAHKRVAEGNTSGLKKFAHAARWQLHEQVEARLVQVLSEGSRARQECGKVVANLEQQVKATSRDDVIERVAYTWFNRFCALRYMDVNHYTRLGTVSAADGFSQPEILMDAKQGLIDDEWQVDKERVLNLLDNSLPNDDPQEAAYQLLLVAVCNRYHDSMPFLFETIAEDTQLLIPAGLLSDNSVLAQVCQTLTPEACASVETIGWLYQFYISEKKSEVFNQLKKGKKITPENIPAATQLFTPHWIVRYLVENSLGRLWLFNYPDSRLAEQMEYYIKPTESEPNFLRISSPEEIKICDPACGSGHMLTYAFDLLYAIYEECGYRGADIPSLILTHNLFGIEIDQRAGALAAFALTMKAREKHPRFLNAGKIARPNICVLKNIHIDPNDFSAYMNEVGSDLFSDQFQGFVNQFEEMSDFGSLIRPLVNDVSHLRELLHVRKPENDIFFTGVHQKVITMLQQAEYLRSKYHVVVANPPYMGARASLPRMKDFFTTHYPQSKSDTFAMFIERNAELVMKSGYIAMITMQSWMFLSSYKDFRKSLLRQMYLVTMAHFGPHAFDSIGGQVVATTGFVLQRSTPGHSSTFFRLVDGECEADKISLFQEILQNEHSTRRFCRHAHDFGKIPGSPMAYWASDSTFDAFEKYSSLKEVASPKQGLATTDNHKFTRQWWEISYASIGLGFRSREEAAASSLRWFPFDKGGRFRKWFGNNEYVVDWENDGMRIKESIVVKYPYLNGKPDFVAKNPSFYFQPGITWSAITSNLSVRWDDAGFIPSNAGMKVYHQDPDFCIELLAYMNSTVVRMFTNCLSETLNFDQGVISRLPLVTESSQRQQLPEWRELIEIAKRDWDRSENSWDYRCNALCQNRHHGLIESVYRSLRSSWQEQVMATKNAESASNEYFATWFGLQEEVNCSVPTEEVTLSVNPRYRYGGGKSDGELEIILRADTMRELISYGVGCMLGRYSLDKPGLVLANQRQTVDDYRQRIPEPTYSPDENNVILMLDGNWFSNDISKRFQTFLKVAFGVEKYEKNISFLENSLYPENNQGKRRKTIRDYFLKEFYSHHVKTYKKRPVYWLFSSSRGTFNALIYMHRYRPDTLNVVLSYLCDLQAKFMAEIEHLQTTFENSEVTQRQKAKALQTVNGFKKKIKELEEYEQEVLHPLATQQIEIDLHDGVKVNYNKFGKALLKVTGLTEN